MNGAERGAYGVRKRMTGGGSGTLGGGWGEGGDRERERLSRRISSGTGGSNRSADDEGRIGTVPGRFIRESCARTADNHAGRARASAAVAEEGREGRTRLPPRSSSSPRLCSCPAWTVGIR
uniref:Uncharacterized protein n=1 Tax=Plectus sambesii TaxID=2011161 RepID=A0A914XGD8_9BILA